MRRITSCRLSGDTLVELIVAAIIFLLIFGISLSTITSLTLRDDDRTIMTDVEYQIEQLYSDISKGDHADGMFSIDYHWGSIEIKIAPYNEYQDLQEITINAKVNSSRKSIAYKHIINRKQ